MPVPSDLTTPAAEGSRPVSARLQNSDRLAIRPNYPWFYVHYPDHPGNWFVGTIEAGPDVPDEDVGDWWLPKLQTEPVIPGVNHHKTLKRGQQPEVAYNDAHGKIRLDGGWILPHSLWYMREMDCADPRTQREGVYHIDVWSRPRKTTRRGKRLKFDFDRQRFYRWLLQLMRSGELSLPDPLILAERSEQYARRVERIENEPDVLPERRLKRLQERQDSADRVAGAKSIEEVAPTPRATRAPTASKPAATTPAPKPAPTPKKD